MINKSAGEIYNGNLIKLGGKDMVIKFFAKAHDPDNGESAQKHSLGIESYNWGIRKVGSNSNIDFVNIVLNKDSYTFTYRELLELGLEIQIGEPYEVFLKVEDDDRSITGNAYGFAIRKAGEFMLAHPLSAPDMFDNTFDEWILSRY